MSQLTLFQRLAQDLLDTRIIASPGRADRVDHIGVQAEADVDLRGDGRRSAELLPGLVLLREDLLEWPRPRKLGIGGFRNVGRFPIRLRYIGRPLNPAHTLALSRRLARLNPIARTTPPRIVNHSTYTGRQSAHKQENEV